LLLVFTGAGLFLIPKFRGRLEYLAHRLEALNPNQALTFILLSAGFVLLPIISFKLRAHTSLGTHAYDLGLFSNICWNTAHDRWFFSSLYERNFMGIHASWILWPLSFFYKLGFGAGILLVAQALFICAAVPFLWMTVQRVTRSFTAGFLASIMYLSSPFVGHSLGNDFHPDTWLLPCLFAMLWAWQREKKWEMILYGCLGLLAKEDISIVLTGFGIFLLLKRGWRVWGAGFILIAVSVFLFHTQVFIPRFIDEGFQSLLFDRYRFLGGSFEGMLKNLILHPMVYLKAFFYYPPKFWTLLNYFFPAALLTFLSPSFLIPIFVSVLPHIMAQAMTQLHLADIYSLPSQPFIFIGAAYGFMKLMKYDVMWKKQAWVAGLCLIIAGLGIRNTPRFYRKETEARMMAFYALAEKVPKEASVAAQQNLLSHFDTRPLIQLFPLGIGTPNVQSRYLKNPDYIVCDRKGNALPYDGPHLRDSIVELSNNSSYSKVYEKEDFLLFKRMDKKELKWVKE